MTLTFKEVSEIMKIIDASECEEVVLELQDFRLVVRRGGTGAPLTTTGQGPAAVSQAPSEPAPSLTANQPPPATAPAAPAAASVSGTEVRAPMVGSFYRRPSPDQEPFVEIGTKVQPGDPLCLIEVMKLYTTIEATTAGTVKQIAAEDAELVEFDQLLFVIAE